VRADRTLILLKTRNRALGLAFLRNQSEEGDLASSQRELSRTGIAVGTIVSSSAAPYGYTVSLWSSGALLIHSHSIPAVWEVFLCAAGAIAGFGLIGAIAHGRMWAEQTLPPGPQHLLAGLSHWFAVGVAVGAVALVSMIGGWIAWPLGSFVCTTLYLLGAAFQLSLVTRLGSRPT
jgi:hypothetical protein